MNTVKPPLALQLGRSFGLLAALALYRFLFAVGTLSVSLLSAWYIVQPALLWLGNLLDLMWLHSLSANILSSAIANSA